MVSAQVPSFSLYIHWPFCLSKCPYCDFNSHVRDQHDSDTWVNAVLSEIKYYNTLFPKGHLKTIFFGGGTPSLIPPHHVEKLIATATNLWTSDPTLEITLEANPTSSEAENFRTLRQAGVNRLSLGLQALNDKDLHYLGRQHSAKEGLAALEMAMKAMDRVSFDLIYARSYQTLDDWDRELNQALKLGTTHLSLYQLTMEPGTAFHTAHKAGKLPIPEEDLAADFYALTNEITAEAGLLSYEISNYAKPGEECCHNLTYWHSGNYIGVGPGAHGRYTQSGNKRIATQNHRAPETWLHAVKEKNKPGLKESFELDRQTQLEEALMMGLRLTTGFDFQNCLTKIGYQTNPLEPAIQTLEVEGYLETSPNGNLAATYNGRLCLNSVLRFLFDALSY